MGGVFMDGNSGADFEFPLLLTIWMMFSAMGFVVASLFWFRRALKCGVDVAPPYAVSVWTGQGLVFIWIVVISVATQLTGLQPASPRALVIEAGGLMTLILILWVRIPAQQRSPSAVVRLCARFVGFGCACLVGWVMTLALGGMIWAVSVFGIAMTTAGAVSFAVLVAGGLWILPVMVLYRRLRLQDKNADEAAHTGVGRFYQYLWPVLCAYLVLWLPLVIHQKVTSPEWQMGQYEKPVRKI